MSAAAGGPATARGGPGRRAGGPLPGRAGGPWARTALPGCWQARGSTSAGRVGAGPSEDPPWWPLPTAPPDPPCHPPRPAPRPALQDLGRRHRQPRARPGPVHPDLQIRGAGPAGRRPELLWRRGLCRLPHRAAEARAVGGWRSRLTLVMRCLQTPGPPGLMAGHAVVMRRRSCPFPAGPQKGRGAPGSAELRLPGGGRAALWREHRVASTCGTASTL